MAKKITLFENLRAVPYVPFYLAIAQGVWNREGLDVRIETSPAMSQTAEALLDGRADVSWGGPMRVLTYHDKDPNCPLICFGHVVARDPFVLVGREPNNNFRFSDLSNLKVAIAVEAPTPWMTFQDDLKRAGLTLNCFKHTRSQPMSEKVIDLRAGKVDVIQVFEPYVDQLISNGHGHIWHRFANRGDIAYTTFYTTRYFAEQHRDQCRALVRGIANMQITLHTETASRIAKCIRRFFPTLTLKQLSRIISGYRNSRLWAKSPTLSPEAFVRLKSALLSGELISRDIPYENVVDEELSNTALQT